MLNGLAGLTGKPPLRGVWDADALARSLKQ
jgi:hypothetical protein